MQTSFTEPPNSSSFPSHPTPRHPTSVPSHPTLLSSSHPETKGRRQGTWRDGDRADRVCWQLRWLRSHTLIFGSCTSLVWFGFLKLGNSCCWNITLTWPTYLGVAAEWSSEVPGLRCSYRPGAHSRCYLTYVERVVTISPTAEGAFSPVLRFVIVPVLSRFYAVCIRTAMHSTGRNLWRHTNVN